MVEAGRGSRGPQRITGACGTSTGIVAKTSKDEWRSAVLNVGNFGTSRRHRENLESGERLATCDWEDRLSAFSGPNHTCLQPARPGIGTVLTVGRGCAAHI